MAGNAGFWAFLQTKNARYDRCHITPSGQNWSVRYIDEKGRQMTDAVATKDVTRCIKYVD